MVFIQVIYYALHHHVPSLRQAFARESAGQLWNNKPKPYMLPCLSAMHPGSWRLLWASALSLLTTVLLASSRWRPWSRCCRKASLWPPTRTCGTVSSCSEAGPQQACCYAWCKCGVFVIVYVCNCVYACAYACTYTCVGMGVGVGVGVGG